jgi:hypothetical protein
MNTRRIRIILAPLLAFPLFHCADGALDRTATSVGAAVTGQEVNPPSGAQASAETPEQIALGWYPAYVGGSEAPQPVALQSLYRDGVLLATLGGTDNRYVDTVTPESQHAYFVTGTDDAGNVSAPSNTASATTPTLCSTPCSIWNNAGQRGLNVLDPKEVELGVAFTSDVAGQVAGVRIEFEHADGQRRTVSLWNDKGERLASAESDPEDGSFYGFRDVLFDAPVSIDAGTTYVASYHEAGGYYPASPVYFTSAFDSPPLHAPNGDTNGRYHYGPSSFPDQTYRATSYWVDVIFVPASVCPNARARRARR